MTETRLPDPEAPPAGRSGTAAASSGPPPRSALLRKARPFLIVGGIAGAAALAGLWPSREPPPPPSRVATPPTLDPVQRGNPLTEEFRRQIEEANRQRAEEAFRTGGSALPRPVLEPETKPPAVPPERPAAALPSPPAPVLPPALPPSLPPRLPASEPVSPPPSPQDISNLLLAMQRQAQDALGGRIVAAQTMLFRDRSERVEGPERAEIPAPTIRPEGEGRERSGLVPAPGTVLRARLLGRAVSTEPGPVLAEIVQGPLRGARLIGEFRPGQEGLLMAFRRMSVPREDGVETVAVEAVAVDPETLAPSVATSVDRRLVERLATAFVTSFMAGIGQAIGRSGQVLTTGPFGTISQQTGQLNTRQQLLVGAGSAAQTLGRLADEEFGRRGPLIEAAQGAAIGVLFL